MFKESLIEMRDAVLKFTKASEEIAGMTGESVSDVLDRNLPKKPIAPERGQVIPMQRIAGGAA